MRDFQITDKDRYELETAAWLHDCGKIATPEHIMDKATKLECIYDRIHDLEIRFEVLRRDAEIEFLKAILQAGDKSLQEATAESRYRKLCRQYENDLAFLREVNIGAESMSSDDIGRIHQISGMKWKDAKGVERSMLSDDEVMNLSVQRGTLNESERQVINSHIDVTIKMLESLPFPKHLQNVPEYAGGHHEKVDGTGYPRGLRREDMSVQARLMAIADIFEALTARDRPYKQGKKLSECLRIMDSMKQRGHIDPDIFDIFIRDRVYLQYAKEFLDPEQIDEIDDALFLGYPASA